jgi:hypothetical protein
MPLFLRFLQIFEARPAYPVALASSLCVLLLLGIVNVEQNPELTSSWGAGAAAPVADSTSGDNLLAYSGSTNSPSDTSLFNVKPNPLFKQVSFSTGN